MLETGKDQFGKDLAVQPRLCAVWVHRTVSGALGWLWRTGCSRGSSAAYGYKSPDCPVSQQSAGPTVGRVIRARRVAEPTVRRGTGLSGVHRTVSGVHRTVSGEPTVAEPTVGRLIRARRVAEPTARRGHQTVRCAPDNVRCANGSKAPTVGFAKEGKKSAPDSVRWCTGLSGAPGDRRQELPS